MSSPYFFVSYSRDDRPYVDRLVAHLKAHGLDIWYDYEINVADRFAKTIAQKIDECAAFIVVMTPDADGSDWVAREIARAEARRKVIVPILLRGEVFFHFGHLNYEDVTGAIMPPARFIAYLRQLAGTNLAAPGPTSLPVSLIDSSPTSGAARPTPPWRIATASAQIRFDGLYQVPAAPHGSEYLRFYASGKVISVTSTGTAHQIVQWFDITKRELPNGTYKIEGRMVSFSTTSASGTVEYFGTVSLDNEQLRLHTRSRINGHEADRVYRFVSFDSLK